MKNGGLLVVFFFRKIDQAILWDGQRVKDETTCIEPRGLTSELRLDAGDDLDE
jgi:hypothetical protein